MSAAERGTGAGGRDPERAAGSLPHEGSPERQALEQICEVAAVPVGQVLLPPEERIRSLTAKLGWIRDIASEREPDEDWGPALIEEVGGPDPAGAAGFPVLPEGRTGGPVRSVRRRFAENIERLCHEGGLSPEDLASRMRVGLGDLEEILHGERRVLLGELVRLSRALDVQIDDLMDGIDWDPPTEGGPGWIVAAGDQDA